MEEVRELSNLAERGAALRKAMPLEVQLAIYEHTLGDSIIVNTWEESMALRKKRKGHRGWDPLRSARTRYQERLQTSQNLLLVFPVLADVKDMINSRMFGLFDRNRTTFICSFGHFAVRNHFNNFMTEKHQAYVGRLRCDVWPSYNFRAHDLFHAHRQFKRLKEMTFFYFQPRDLSLTQDAQEVNSKGCMQFSEDIVKSETRLWQERVGLTEECEEPWTSLASFGMVE